MRPITRTQQGPVLRQDYGGFVIPWTFTLGKAQPDETIALIQQVTLKAFVHAPAGRTRVEVNRTYVEVIGFIKPNDTAVTIPGTTANLNVIVNSAKSVDPNLTGTAPVTLPPDTPSQKWYPPSWTVGFGKVRTSMTLLSPNWDWIILRGGTSR